MCQCIDGVFVLDVSRSIGFKAKAKEAFNLMKNLMVETFNLVNFSPNCSRAALMLFASNATLEFNLTAHANITSLNKTLNDITLSSLKKFRKDHGTNTADALMLLRTAAQNGILGVDNEDREQIAVIITDGKPHTSKAQKEKGISNAKERTESARTELGRAEIYERIYAIGVQGDNVDEPINEQTLNMIAGNSESTFLLKNFAANEFEEVAENIRFCNPCRSVQCPNGSRCRVWNGTRLTYCEYSCDIDNGGCANESQCEEVDVPTCSPGQCCSRVNVTCVAPDQPDCSTQCIDCVFVFDVSRSIENDVGNDTEGAFHLMKDFMKRIFDFVNISPTCSRAGLIVFANDSRIEFNLNDYTNREDIEKALNDITLESLSIEGFHGDPGTNTPGVLQLMLDAAKDGRLGLNHKYRVQIAIVITDGRPSLRNISDEDEQTREASVRLHSSGIYERIYAIGVQGRQNRTIHNQTLKNIAGNSSGSTFLLRNFSQSQFNLALEDIEAEFSNNPCLSVQCPFGSKCKVCNETCETYCEYACDIDNGGCDEGSQCVEVDVPTCRSGQCCASVNVTCRKSCTVEGQVYSEQAPALEYQPTCNKPHRTYCPTAAIPSGCVCPNGAVIDEIQNKCVPLSECTCPPQCSHDYCSSELAKSNGTKIPCMRGFPPYTEADSADDCKRTYCHLCDYYYRSPTDDPVYMCRF